MPKRLFSEYDIGRSEINNLLYVEQRSFLTQTFSSRSKQLKLMISQHSSMIVCLAITTLYCIVEMIILMCQSSQINPFSLVFQTRTAHFTVQICFRSVQSSVLRFPYAVQTLDGTFNHVRIIQNIELNNALREYEHNLIMQTIKACQFPRKAFTFLLICKRKM